MTLTKTQHGMEYVNPVSCIFSALSDASKSLDFVVPSFFVCSAQLNYELYDYSVPKKSSSKKFNECHVLAKL